MKRALRSSNEIDKVRFCAPESIDCFRIRFLNALGFSNERYKFIFSSSPISSNSIPKERGEKEIKKIVGLLLKYEEFAKFKFQVLLSNCWKTDSEMNKRINQFFKFYFGGNEEEYFDEKLLILRGFHQVFFGGKWPEHLILKCRRGEEETVMKTTDFEREITHVDLFGFEVHIDLGYLILSFIEHDQTLIHSLGCISESWLYIIFTSWKYVTSTPRNCRKIPLSVLENVEGLRIQQKTWDYNQHEIWLSLVDLNYVFSRIDPLKLKILNLTEFSEIEGTRFIPVSCDLPKLEVLLLPKSRRVNDEIVSLKPISPNILKIFCIRSPNLKYLQISHRDFLGFIKSKNKCKDLKTLKLIVEEHRRCRRLKKLFDFLENEKECFPYHLNKLIVSEKIRRVNGTPGNQHISLFGNRFLHLLLQRTHTIEHFEYITEKCHLYSHNLNFSFESEKTEKSEIFQILQSIK